MHLRATLLLMMEPRPAGLHVGGALLIDLHVYAHAQDEWLDRNYVSVPVRPTHANGHRSM